MTREWPAPMEQDGPTQAELAEIEQELDQDDDAVIDYYTGWDVH